jgi:ribosomal protein L37AE/L43A
MPRVCRTCGRVVAEAAYCPFCSQPTIEFVPAPIHRSEVSEVRTLLTEFQRRNSRWMFVASITATIVGAFAAFSPIWVSGAFAPIIGLAGFVLIGAGLFIILYVLLSACPCPRCEKNLAHLTGQNIRYCPFCGADLAVEIYPKSQELKEFLERISGQGELEIKNTGTQLLPREQKANPDIQLPSGNEEKGAAK